MMISQGNIEGFLHNIDHAIRRVQHDLHVTVFVGDRRQDRREVMPRRDDRSCYAHISPRRGKAVLDACFRRLGLDKHRGNMAKKFVSSFGH